MAEISLGKVFMTPKGVWDGTKQYQSLDIVMVRGATSSTGYISTDVIPANTPINDKRWKVLFTVNDGEATDDFNNKVNKVDANKKAIDTIYAELQKMYGVQISDTEPTEERTGIWVDTNSTETFSVPEIKDNVVNTTDTWSSQKINQMVSVDSYATKSDACADDDRVAIYDSASKTQKKALFGGGVWNWIVNKLTNAVISNLQTNNKTVLGAINELNSKWLENIDTIQGSTNLEEFKPTTGEKAPGIYKIQGAVIEGISSEVFYGTLILLPVYNTQILIVGGGITYARDYTGSPATWATWKKYNYTAIK